MTRLIQINSFPSIRWLRCTTTTVSSASQRELFSTINYSDRTKTKTQNSIPFYGLPRPPQIESDDSISSFKKRLVVALRSASTAFRDPTRDDAVAALGEVSGTVALHCLVEQLRNHPIGCRVLKEKPIISKSTIPLEEILEKARYIESTPSAEITFGQAYGHFLSRHGFDPDERKPVQYLEENSDAAYVMLRYRQCHDYWHTLTGLPPTVLGELGLKWLELFQTGLPLAALSGTVGSLSLDYKQQHILWNIYVPWAIRCHKIQQQKDFNGSILSVYYEEEFDTPLEELRERIGIEPAPTIGAEY